MLRLFFILLFIFFTKPFLYGQELNCNVKIDYSNIQLTTADKALINDVQNAIMNFMNTRKWTNDVFNPEERIKCNIYITVTSLPAFGSFEATASIQSSRPVFESTYESTLLNFFDKKFNFDYNPSQPMDYNENTFFSNLTSLLSFYAYIIIGMDYDSFSNMGGTPYFEKARNIANVAQPYQDAWNPGEGTNNRYWLMENLNNQQMVPLREGFYTYHLKAMDSFIKNPDQSRKEIFEVLKKIKKIQQYNPVSILVKSFFLAKSGELINVFKDAPSDMKKQVVDLLRELDPLNADKYQMQILGK
jgi:hypothetical protein